MSRSRATTPGIDGSAAAVDEHVVRIEAAVAELFRLANNRRIARERQQRLGTDLATTALELLRRVDDHGPVTVTRLSQLLGMSLATTSRTATDLESRGLLLRRDDPADGRIVRFVTSAKGRRARQRFQESTQRDLARVLERWEPSDRARLAELFGRLVDEMLDGRD